MGFTEALAMSLTTGLFSSVATIAALRTEIGWIKSVQKDQEARIRKLEMAKTGLKSNGRLKKGYRFAKGGRVVKAKGTTTKRKTRRKRK